MQKLFKNLSDTSLLRLYIKSFLLESDDKRSAGIVILKRFNDGWKVLVLKDSRGRFDITKGLVEPGESNIMGAIREAEEEAGIILTKENFSWGFNSISYGKGCVFIAQTSQTPFICPNPETGNLEHVSWEWLDFNEAIEKVIDYLKPAIAWAQTVVSQSQRV